MDFDLTTVEEPLFTADPVFDVPEFDVAVTDVDPTVEYNFDDVDFSEGFTSDLGGYGSFEGVTYTPDSDIDASVSITDTDGYSGISSSISVSGSGSASLQTSVGDPGVLDQTNADITTSFETESFSNVSYDDVLSFESETEIDVAIEGFVVDTTVEPVVTDADVSGFSGVDTGIAIETLLPPADIAA